MLSPLTAQRQAVYKHVSFSYDTSFASSVTGTTMPRSVNPEGPYWAQYPEHISMQLNGFPNVGQFNEALVRIYPIAEYLSILPDLEPEVTSLKSLIATRPNLRQRFPAAYPDGSNGNILPSLPPNGSVVVLDVKLDYLTFKSGSGIRYVAGYAQAVSPFSTDFLHYVYQGVTSDGKNLVTMTLPLDAVASTTRPPSPNASDEVILEYNRKEAARLDALAPASYMPNLNQLDDLVRSITVSGTTPVVTTYTFPQTGITVSGRFWEVWQSSRLFADSLYINGLPLTVPRQEVSPTDGKLYMTQWFERARFEQHPENPQPHDVLLGLLGARSAQDRLNEAPFKPIPEPNNGLAWFPETGHTLGDPGTGGRAIADAWNQMGGLSQFGYPISQPFFETSRDDGKSYVVQYFQRQRLEYHPENKGTRYEVLLGRLGAEQKDK